MSNEDKRRRRDSSTTQLSVADLIARREAETQPIPIIRVDDTEETVRFAPVKPSPLSGRELHIAELLRREGRPTDEERGGLRFSRLVAMASGGVVLCGSVAFGASQWLSSPDERPLADVRFDTRPAARNAQGTVDIAAAGRQAQPGTSTTTDPTTTNPTTQQPGQRQTATPQPGTGSPTTDPTTADPTTPTETSTTTQPSPPPSSSTPPPTSTTTPPPSSDTAPSTSTPSTPPSTSEPSTPPTTPSVGIGIGLGLGNLLEPLGGFDFFAA